MPLIRDFNDPNLVPMDNPIEARKNDLLRITEWLKSPAGLKFAAKQGLLRATAGNNSNNRADLLRNAGQGAVDAASAIAVILAQVPVAGTGTHFLFNELSSLAFQNTSFYTGNRFASMQANYRGTITIKTDRTRRIQEGSALDELYNPAVGGIRERGADYYDDISRDKYVDFEDIKKDLVPFHFGIVEVVDGIPQVSKYLQFRAQFIGQLQDNFNGIWSNVGYVGRAEDFYVYTKFRRSMSFSFRVAAFTKAETPSLLNKVNKLASFTAPTYSESSKFMRGNIVRLTIGDYVKFLPGKIDSVNVVTSFDEPWDVHNPNQIMPTIATVSVQFTPIHNFVPETDLGYGTVDPFIGTAQGPYRLTQAQQDERAAAEAQAAAQAEERRMQEAEDYFGRSSFDPTLRF
jgi:hypothetical protein